MEKQIKVNKAFVFGKFLPFHIGHEALIKFAISKCNFLSVLVCSSDKEKVNSEIRVKWIKDAFKSNINLEIISFNYLEDEYPNSSESSLEISRQWSKVFKKMFPEYELVITSEKYGDYIADFLGIKHLKYDEFRTNIPISATFIQNDIFKYWDFLPLSVKRHFAIKVIILGTESSGKTTLVNKLSKYYNCTKVDEAGRELIADSNYFDLETLKKVVNAHNENINNSDLTNSTLLIIDTDVNITKSYSRFILGIDLEVDSDIIANQKADLYLYLNKDVPYIQDGTRLNEDNRNNLDVSHREILQLNNINFQELVGDYDDRFYKAIKLIDNLLLQKKTLKLRHDN